jgi:hypothetical protein
MFFIFEFIPFWPDNSEIAPAERQYQQYTFSLR